MHEWVRGAWVSLCMRWVGAWIGSLGRCACACAYMRASAHWCACVHVCIVLQWVGLCRAALLARTRGCMDACVGASMHRVGRCIRGWFHLFLRASFHAIVCACL